MWFFLSYKEFLIIFLCTFDRLSLRHCFINYCQLWSTQTMKHVLEHIASSLLFLCHLQFVLVDPHLIPSQKRRWIFPGHSQELYLSFLLQLPSLRSWGERKFLHEKVFVKRTMKIQVMRGNKEIPIMGFWADWGLLIVGHVA